MAKRRKPTHSCPATIVFADDHGDNECTFHCTLLPGHEGEHAESGNRGGRLPGLLQRLDIHYEIPYHLCWSGSSAEYERQWDEYEDRVEEEAEHA